MALSNEDKKDVSRAFGKKAASAVSEATKDRHHKTALGAVKSKSLNAINMHFSESDIRGQKAVSDANKRYAAKSKALKSKTGGFKSYQPDQMYSDAAMKRFSAKRKRLGHND